MVKKKCFDCLIFSNSSYCLDSEKEDDEEEFLTADEETKEDSRENTGLKSLLEDDVSLYE